MSTIVAYRWEFHRSTLIHRSFAEAELTEIGRPGDTRYMARVYLVRDEMVQPKANALADPDRREGMRVYVGTSQDEEACRALAFLAPVEATRRAYPLIYKVLLDNPDKVRRFGDEWLTALISEARVPS